MITDAIPGWVFYVLAGIIGAILGSFANVCIVRMPKGESIVRPRSRCPRCG
ncbi:MAG TPA: prepilin peptidase, partial [bacterium]|nr:prepilin peptidase [bacterium]